MESYIPSLIRRNNLPYRCSFLLMFLNIATCCCRQTIRVPAPRCYSIQNVRGFAKRSNTLPITKENLVLSLVIFGQPFSWQLIYDIIPLVLINFIKSKIFDNKYIVRGSIEKTFASSSLHSLYMPPKWPGCPSWICVGAWTLSTPILP